MKGHRIDCGAAGCAIVVALLAGCGSASPAVSPVDLAVPSATVSPAAGVESSAMPSTAPGIVAVADPAAGVRIAAPFEFAPLDEPGSRRIRHQGGGQVGVLYGYGPRDVGDRGWIDSVSGQRYGKDRPKPVGRTIGGQEVVVYPTWGDHTGMAMFWLGTEAYALESFGHLQALLAAILEVGPSS